MASRLSNQYWAPPGPHQLATMEATILALLTKTQGSARGPREEAERELLQLHGNVLFPEGLLDVAANPQVATNNRQAALLVLRQYVKKGWSDDISGFQGVVLPSDTVKHFVRSILLSIALNDNNDSKIINAAAIVITDIAHGDFPHEWPDLFNVILGKVPTANNAQTQGILMVLATMIDSGGIDHEEFRPEFVKIINVIHGVVVSDTHLVQTRAYALQTLKEATDVIYVMKESDKQLTRDMANQVVDKFSKFFLEVLSEPMPLVPTKEQEDEGTQEYKQWRDMVQLKAQAAKVNIQKTTMNENGGH